MAVVASLPSKVRRSDLFDCVGLLSSALLFFLLHFPDDICQSATVRRSFGRGKLHGAGGGVGEGGAARSSMGKAAKKGNSQRKLFLNTAAYPLVIDGTLKAKFDYKNVDFIIIFFTQIFLVALLCINLLLCLDLHCLGQLPFAKSWNTDRKHRGRFQVLLYSE